MNVGVDDVRLIGGNINGRYSLASGGRKASSFACRAQSISPRAIALAAPVSGSVNEPVNVHFADFGILQGRISRLLDFGFVMDVIATADERVKIAAKIRWLRKHAAQEAPELRQHKRMPPRNPRTTLTLDDGTTLPCFIIDQSPSGAAVSADIAPDLHQELVVGRVHGKVIRHLDPGFAIEFTSIQDPTMLDKVLAPVEQPTAPAEAAAF